MNLLDGTHGALSDQQFMARVEDENEERERTVHGRVEPRTGALGDG